MSIPHVPSAATRALVWTLRAAVAVDCLGIVALERAAGTPIFSLLWNSPEVGGWGWSEVAAVATEQTAAWTLLCVAPFVFCRRAWPVLIPVAVWQLLIALVAVQLADTPFSEWSVGSRAVRIAAPLALVLLEAWTNSGEVSIGRRAAALWLLRIAAAITFVAHGYQSFELHPVFVDYLIAGGERLLSVRVAQSTAEMTLHVIGVVDFILAALLLCRRWPSVAFYMAAWGAITALARVVHSGSGAYYEVLLRGTNCGVPLAIGLYWLLDRTSPPATHPPAKIASHADSHSTDSNSA